MLVVSVTLVVKRVIPMARTVQAGDDTPVWMCGCVSTVCRVSPARADSREFVQVPASDLFLQVEDPSPAFRKGFESP